MLTRRQLQYSQSRNTSITRYISVPSTAASPRDNNPLPKQPDSLVGTSSLDEGCLYLSYPTASLNCCTMHSQRGCHASQMPSTHMPTTPDNHPRRSSVEGKGFDSKYRCPQSACASRAKLDSTMWQMQQHAAQCGHVDMQIWNRK